MHLLYSCKVDLEIAVSDISAEVERLSVNGSAKYLPINSYAAWFSFISFAISLYLGDVEV